MRQREHDWWESSLSHHHHRTQQLQGPQRPRATASKSYKYLSNNKICNRVGVGSVSSRIASCEGANQGNTTERCCRSVLCGQSTAAPARVPDDSRSSLDIYAEPRSRSALAGPGTGHPGPSSLRSLAEVPVRRHPLARSEIIRVRRFAALRTRSSCAPGASRRSQPDRSPRFPPLER